jgi:hypothetical protein
LASIEFTFAPSVVVSESDARWLARRLLERGLDFEPALRAGLEIEARAAERFGALRTVSLSDEEQHELARVLDHSADQRLGLVEALHRALSVRRRPPAGEAVS